MYFRAEASLSRLRARACGLRCFFLCVGESVRAWRRAVVAGLLPERADIGLYMFLRVCVCAGERGIGFETRRALCFPARCCFRFAGDFFFTVRDTLFTALTLFYFFILVIHASINDSLLDTLCCVRRRVLHVGCVSKRSSVHEQCDALLDERVLSAYFYSKMILICFIVCVYVCVLKFLAVSFAKQDSWSVQLYHHVSLGADES